MRLLLTSNAAHDPPQGGSTRSNLAWMEHFAGQGHDCYAVCPTPGHEDSRVTRRQGVEVRAFRDLSMHPGLLRGQILELQPDWVFVSSEDVAHVLLREAARIAAGRLIYLAHTPQFLPFGPESWNPDPEAAALVQRARAVVAIGQHMRQYIQRHAGVAAHVTHPPLYGAPPWPRFGQFGAGYVLLINPCLVKGVPVFLEMARRFPHVPFAGLAGWGTTGADRAAMQALPNVRVLETVPRIDDVLREATLLLMPSLWYEGFGLIAMEAMLRGLPVIASDSGGLLEAKAGTGYVIPVRGITRYLPKYDERGMPEAVAPEQDAGPWAEALQTLLTDADAYREEAERSRAAAERFVSGLSAAGLAELVASLPPDEQPLDAPAATARPLDAARRALLLDRLKRKRA
jgi:glycosyltransferase involved in cell wall biosynthesis